MITSLTNSRVKKVVELRDRKHRTTRGLTIVEGKREITCAQEAGVIFKEFYYCRDFLSAPKVDDISAASGTNVANLFTKRLFSKVPVYETTKAVFSKMSYGARAEGVLAVCEPRSLSFADFPSKADSLFVIVESVEKPGNLGAILRTCDGAGVDGVIICDGKTDIYNPNVIRASLGTIFSQKIVVSSNEDTLKFLKLNKVTICATLLKAKFIYTNEKLINALAIVVGSEQDGLTKFWIEHADLKVKIPMKGFADSLNVSATTAVLLYEIIRQRSQ